MLFSFIFGGRIPHPSFVLLILSIYIFVVSYQKNTNKVGSKEKVSSQRTSKCLTTIFLQAFFSNVTLYQNMLVILSPNADTWRIKHIYHTFHPSGYRFLLLLSDIFKFDQQLIIISSSCKTFFLCSNPSPFQNVSILASNQEIIFNYLLFWAFQCLEI